MAQSNKAWLALAVLLSAAAAAFAQTEADFNVTLTDDGSGVKILKYTGKTGAVKIPATIEGMPVKEIGGHAFKGLFYIPPGSGQGTTITSVTIPQGVTTIREYAFEGCAGLTSVAIPDSVTEIEKYAFQGCYAQWSVDSTGKQSPKYGIASVTLGKGLVKIGTGAFEGCELLKTITLPEGLQTIENDAFSGCAALTSITIPASVTTLKGFNKSGLVSVTLSKGITVIGQSAFMGSKLKTVVIPEGLTTIEMTAFQECSDLSSVTLPSTIKKIGYSTFASCPVLAAVTIPDSVAAIEFGDGRYVSTFSSCPKLTLASQAAIKRRGYQDSF
jgi:hypothetical protein